MDKVDWVEIERHIEETVKLINAMNETPSVYAIHAAIYDTVKDKDQGQFVHGDSLLPEPMGPSKPLWAQDWRKKTVVHVRVPKKVLDRVARLVSEAEERVLSDHSVHIMARPPQGAFKSPFWTAYGRHRNQG